jgi:molybdate transport system regulatory protein
MNKVSGSIWIETEKGAYLGWGRVALLIKIKEFGSIAEAARSMKMSYRQAWELVKSMNQQANKPLVIALAGGTKGGGTIITEEGENAIKNYSNLMEKFNSFCAEQTKDLIL